LHQTAFKLKDLLRVAACDPHTTDYQHMTTYVVGQSAVEKFTSPNLSACAVLLPLLHSPLLGEVTANLESHQMVPFASLMLAVALHAGKG
jgi:hypothetical protein